MFLKLIPRTAALLLCIASVTAAQGCAAQTMQTSQATQASQTAQASQDSQASQQPDGSSQIIMEDTDMDYLEYVKSHGVDLSGQVTAGEGEIRTLGSGQPDASLRFEVLDGQVENVRESISARMGEECEISEETLPQGSEDKYMQMVEAEKVVADWFGFENGVNGAKTHSIEMFLTENNGTYFVYFFG